MENKIPLLSIGLPVFNGEKYLSYTLDSILNQTFSDFELIISDNASTDNTRDLCQKYAARDHRIRYHRNQKNIGATQNWYQVFELSSGKYFASVAHDDVYDPEYMQKCIDVLKNDPSIVVCYSKTKVIDETGNLMGNFDVAVDTTSVSPHDRLYNVIKIDYLCIQLYGVMRSSALRSTKVFVGYYGCDRNTLAELCLLGKVKEIPEYLFFHRLYPEALGAAMNSGKSLDELSLLDPGTDWRLRSTTMTIYQKYFASVGRLILSSKERVKCYITLLRLIFEKISKRIERILKLDH